ETVIPTVESVDRELALDRSSSSHALEQSPNLLRAAVLRLQPGTNQQQGEKAARAAAVRRPLARPPSAFAAIRRTSGSSSLSASRSARVAAGSSMSSRA